MSVVSTTLALRDQITQRLRGPVNELKHMTQQAENTNKQLQRMSRMRVDPQISLSDRATRPMNQLRTGLNALNRMNVAPTIEANDRATRVTNQLRTGLSALNRMTVQPVIVARNRADREIQRVRTDLRILARMSVQPIVAVRDRATNDLRRINRLARALSGQAAELTVKVKDQATGKLREIGGRLGSLKSKAGLIVGAAAGVAGTAAGPVTQGFNSYKNDAIIAATSNAYVGNVRAGVDDIYYNYKGGLSRENVAQIYGNVANFTGSQGDRLHQQAAIVAQYQALNPESDPKEITRAFSAMYNSQGADFKRTGNSLAYVRRNGGDQYDDLLDTYNEYATSASKSGITPEQLANGLVEYQKSGGRNYDNPADALREWGIRSVTTVDKNAVDALTSIFGEKQTKAMYAELKKGFERGDGSQASFDFLSKTVEGLNKIDNPMKKQIAQAALYGTQFEDNDKAVQDFFNGLLTAADTTGELDRQFKSLKDSDPTSAMTESWLRFKKLTKDVGTGTIEALAPVFEEFNKWATSKEGSAAIQQVTSDLKELGTTIGKDVIDGVKWVIENWGALKQIFIGTDDFKVNPFSQIVVDIGKAKEAVDYITKPLQIAHALLRNLNSESQSFTMANVVNWLTNSTGATTPLVNALQTVAKWLGIIQDESASAQTAVSDAVAARQRLGNQLLSNTPLISAVSSRPKPPTVQEQLASNIQSRIPNAGGVPKKKQTPGFAQGLRKVPVEEMNVNVHKDEMIVPAAESELIRSMARNNTPNKPQSATQAPSVGDININWNAPVTINNGMDIVEISNQIGKLLRDQLATFTEGGEILEI